MAKKNTHTVSSERHQRTSIGASSNTRPTNKNKRKQHKAYRGQGRAS